MRVSVDESFSQSKIAQAFQTHHGVIGDTQTSTATLNAGAICQKGILRDVRNTMLNASAFGRIRC